MITRDPDVTRLLDRMEKPGLISRSRDKKDRRTVIGRITTEGLKLLARLDEPIQEIHRKQLGHFGRNQLWSLTELRAAMILVCATGLRQTTPNCTNLAAVPNASRRNC